MIYTSLKYEDKTQQNYQYTFKKVKTERSNKSCPWVVTSGTGKVRRKR
jgi:hypothetical protein